jgi:hypothetical protein
MIHTFTQIDLPQQTNCRVHQFRLDMSFKKSRQHHVLGRCQMIYESQFLKNKPDVRSTESIALLVAQVSISQTQAVNLTFGWQVQRSEQIKESRLAAAARTD